MKNIRNFLFAIIVIAVIYGCNQEEDKKGDLYCDYLTGDSVKSQAGRIYKWTDPSSGAFFYYIGNPDPKLKSGGFVPCNGFPKQFVPEQELEVSVIYSGIVKLGRAAEEPIYFGIQLTEIKKSDR